MFAKERQDIILELLKKHGFTTVSFLTEALHYSTATVNRDLNALESKGLITRSYGGAELKEDHNVPLPFRYSKMRVEKRKIGQAAARLVEAGDIIFIDGATTTEAMAHYITDIKDIAVISCNMAVVTYLSEHGVNAVCLGGRVVEKPSMLYGDDTVLAAARYRADKMFFSTGSVLSDGRICSGPYHMLHTVMAQNSDKIYHLADHEKVNAKSDSFLFDFSRLTAVISDYDFPQETKKRFPDTEFILVT